MSNFISIFVYMIYEIISAPFHIGVLTVIFFSFLLVLFRILVRGEKNDS